MKNIIQLFFLTFCFVSCTTKNGYVDDRNCINIPIVNIEELKLGGYSEIFDSVRIVNLESSDQSLIGRIDKLQFCDNKIFILDQVQSKTVLVFDIYGKFIHKIGMLGKGPGEYDEPNDMVVDPLNKEVAIWCNTFKKILFYDFNGEHKRSLRLDYYIKSFEILDENRYALYLDLGLKQISNTDFNFLIIDNRGRVVYKALNYYTTDEPSKGGFHFFNKCQGEVLISPGYSNKIYSINNDTLKCKYSIDFQDFTIPNDFFKQGIKEFKKNLRKSQYAYLSSFYETSRYLNLNYVFKGKVYNGFYSKQSHTFKSYNFWLNDIEGILSGMLCYCSDNYVISYFDPYNIDALQDMIVYPFNSSLLKESTKAIFNNLSISFNKKEITNYIDSLKFNYSHEDIAKLHKIKPTDNPILIIKTLKTF